MRIQLTLYKIVMSLEAVKSLVNSVQLVPTLVALYRSSDSGPVPVSALPNRNLLFPVVFGLIAMSPERLTQPP